MQRVCSFRQRMILASLTVIWVGILPWLCWGGWSSPHHPHPSPHFVFAQPPLYGNGHHEQSNLDHSGLDHCVDNHIQLAVSGDIQLHDHETPVGVAHPETLLIALLSFVMPFNRWGIGVFARHFRRVLALLPPNLLVMVVPTPPPRLSCP